MKEIVLKEIMRRPAALNLRETAILIKSIFQWIVLIMITLVLGLCASLAALTRLQNWVHVVATWWGRALARGSGAKVRIHNRENLYRDGPVILLSNHQSLFDIPVLYAALDVQFRWMAKASLFKIPIVGWAMKWAGYIPVVRDDRKLALQSLFKAAEKIQDGSSVIIFPEGTWGYPDGSMRPFKKGAFILAKKAAVVIQPITIKGARKIAPEETGTRIQRIYGGEVDVHFHKPLQPAEFADLNADELSERLRKIIESAL